MRDSAASPGSSPDPAPSAGRDAAASPGLRPLCAVVVAAVVVVSLGEHPSPALHGSGLIVAIALVVLAVSTWVLVRRAGAGAHTEVALTCLILASSALVWVQHDGAGQAGLFLAVSLAAMLLDARRSLIALALAVAAFVAAALHAERSFGAIIAVVLGLLAFYTLSLFARRLQEAHAETERLLAELEASRNARAEAAALRERGRLAREMHDVLAHSLSGLTLQLEGARMLAASPSSNGELTVALDRAHQLACAGLEEARRAIGALRDDELPGPDALRQLTVDFERDSHAPARLEVCGSPRGLDSETALTLYRVAQEALTNSRKHGRPQRVELRLGYEPTGTRLVVQDHNEHHSAGEQGRAGERAGAPGAVVNGNRENASGHLGGYGLTGMRERAALLGGYLDAAPTGDGFRVELWVPA